MGLVERFAGWSVLVFVLVVLVIACDRAPGVSDLAVPSIDTLPDGMVVVHNLGPAEWSDTNGWHLELERTIRPAEESAGAMMSPGGIIANASGEIYVLDRGPVGVRHYSADGAFLGMIGREGKGPGEFSDFGILYLVGDTLVHHDQSQARLSLFDRNGAFLGSFRTVSNIGIQMVAGEDGLVPLPVSLPGTDGDRRDAVVRYRLTGELADTIHYPPLPGTPSWEIRSGPVTMGMMVPLASGGWVVPTHSGRLLFGHAAEPVLYLSGIGRDTALRMEVPLPAVEVSDSARRATFEETVSRYPRIAPVARLADIPAVLPRWQELRSDAADNVWVLSQAVGGEPGSWYVVSPEGVFRGRVPAPFTDVDVSYWTADRVYRVAEDADGIPGIEVWRVVKQ